MPAPRRRRSTLSILMMFLAVVALLAGVEIYALWSSNRTHAPAAAAQQ